MITITARCQTCGDAWKPRKTDGPDKDFARAQTWASAHRSSHHGHVTEAKRTDDVVKVHGSRIHYLNVEIIRG